MSERLEAVGYSNASAHGGWRMLRFIAIGFITVGLVLIGVEHLVLPTRRW